MQLAIIFLLSAMALSVDSVNNTRQLQIIKLFNNLFCNRTQDSDLLQAALTFNPSENLEQYRNPNIVLSFANDLEQNKLSPRFDQFADSKREVSELDRMLDIFYAINTDSDEGWALFYKTAAYLSLRVNIVQYVWVLKILMSTKFNGEYKSPQLFEILPQMFAPKEQVNRVNNVEGQKTGKDDQQNLEDLVSYFREDPAINDFHGQWHIDFPFWWNSEKYGYKDRKGELFLYTHHQLQNRYKAERISNNLRPVEPLVLNKTVPIQEGYVPTVLRVNFRDYTSRLPNSYLVDLSSGLTVKDVDTSSKRLYQGISDGYLIIEGGGQVSLEGNVTGSNILGAASEASDDSVNSMYYRSLHNSLHSLLGEIPDPDTPQSVPGAVDYPETAVRDPGFFKIHQYIDDIYDAYKKTLPAYTSEEISYPGVILMSVQILTKTKRKRQFRPFMEISKSTKIQTIFPPYLTTFFETFSFDFSNAVKDCAKVNSGENFSAEVKRLNHHPFEYVITIFNYKFVKENGIMRIFMSLTSDVEGKPFSQADLHWNMIEMDKFPVTLSTGQNVIRRRSQSSSVALLKLQSIKELIKEASTSQSGDKPGRVIRSCGYPQNLLLPKGTREGMRFKLFVMISPAGSSTYNETDYPSLSVCGVPNPKLTYPDGKPMGFPFDKKVDFGFHLPFLSTVNFKFMDIFVKHLGVVNNTRSIK